ncbi:MAG: leucine-rich repeat protein [Clostridia bacterium]|nr:leucine-rich repeat protein [Clostridia bacterium]
MKKILSALLSICVILTMSAAVIPAVSAETGSVSENISWSIEGSTMYVNGNGDMKLTYEYLPDIPWYAEGTKNVETLIIGEGVTSIDEGAFNAFRKLKNVQFPESMSVIGPSAFLSCEALEEVILNDRVTRIESGAFAGCEALKVLSVPGNTYYISGDAFYNCFDLTIRGISGSYAEEFAKEMNIPFDGSRPLPADIMVTVNKKILTFDQPPVIVNDRTLVPLRAIFEALGATVEWAPETRTVTAKRGEDTLSLVIDTNVINKNGTNIEIDVPAQIIGDRTMVPVRAISETLGASVDWNAGTRTVIIDD